jgi:hypothetical protein
MHEEKEVYDRDEFLVWVVILAVVSFKSWRRNDDGIVHIGEKIHKESAAKVDDDTIDTAQRGIDAKEETITTPKQKHHTTLAKLPSPENEVLNRQQTEEWKGWMQLILLLYHYMHATEVYNGIRVMITCYVWLTGFGTSLV